MTGLQFAVFDLRPAALGLRSAALDLWFVAPDLQLAALGLQLATPGLRFVFVGSWPAALDLWFVFVGSWAHRTYLSRQRHIVPKTTDNGRPLLLELKITRTVCSSQITSFFATSKCQAEICKMFFVANKAF